MKILFIIELYYPHIGGAEVLFKNLAEKLVEKGNEITVLTTRLSGYQKEEIIGGVKIIRLNCGNRYLFTFLAWWQGWKLAREVDLIQTTTYNAALPAWIVAKLSKKPCIITVHEYWSEFWKKVPGFTLLHRIFEWFVISLPFDEYIADSRYTAKCLLVSGIKAKKIKVIYPGIDYDLFNKDKYDRNKSRKKFEFKSSDFIYLYFGRPGWAKGLEYLIKATPKISQKIPNSKFLLILSHTPNKQYKWMLKLISQLSTTNRQRLIIYDPVPREKLPEYLKIADCVVVPSLMEGFGFTAAEACSLRVPLVASKTGSLPEVVSGKVVWIRSGDESSLVKGVTKLFHRKWEIIPTRRFEWDDCIEKYLDVYKSIL